MVHLAGLTTEQQNPASMHIDSASTEEMLYIINREDQKVTLAVAEQIGLIAKAVDGIVPRLRDGGRPRRRGTGN